MYKKIRKSLIIRTLYLKVDFVNAFKLEALEICKNRQMFLIILDPFSTLFTQIFSCLGFRPNLLNFSLEWQFIKIAIFKKSIRTV